MRTRQRLTGLKAWAVRELCAGRMLKAPSSDMDITDMTLKEPVCYLGWHPRRADGGEAEPASVCPGILIMPGLSKGKFVEERRLDRDKGIYRVQEFGQTLSVSILFSVYEPGIRLPGFIESADSEQGLDMSLLREGTEEGLLTLTDWMDDCVAKLLGERNIPGTDLFVMDETLNYSLYADGGYVVDKRPIFYGFVNVEFGCYAEEQNPRIDQFLL